MGIEDGLARRESLTTVQRWKRDLSWEYRKLQGKGVFFRFWMAMLALGIVEHAWEFYTGAGVSGYMMRRQLENSGTLSVGFWPAMAFCLLVVGPFVMLGITEPKRDPNRTGKWHVSGKVVLLSVCLLLTAMSALGYWMANSGPDTKASPISLDVGAMSDGLKDGMVQLRGVPQPSQGISYVAVSSWVRDIEVEIKLPGGTPSSFRSGHSGESSGGRGWSWHR